MQLGQAGTDSRLTEHEFQLPLNRRCFVFTL